MVFVIESFCGGDWSSKVGSYHDNNVDIWNEGLGENPHVQDLFLKHLGQAIRMSDRKRPMPRESVKPVMTNSRLEAQGLIS